LGVNHAVILRTLRQNAVIEIGDDTGISGATICAAELVSIGKGCLIGANVTIVDTDFHAIKPQSRRYNSNPVDIATSPVRIGDNVFIGTGAIILKGVTLGNDSVIGAGAVVVENVPAGHIAAGNPAKSLRSLYIERPSL
jgi:acetyltransferase-like isoleucine patch superfamily enzyme